MEGKLYSWKRKDCDSSKNRWVLVPIDVSVHRLRQAVTFTPVEKGTGSGTNMQQEYWGM